MSEVKNVTITVPVGLNGWQQEGSVVINGMKVEFPVGVETEVPETAAALLKELIEAAEKRTENVPANNDYKGSLTVPAGHTLRIEKGAKFLNYGDEEVVNLPATEAIVMNDSGDMGLTTPWTVEIETGKTYTVNYNGTDYECLAIDMSAINPEAPAGTCVLGNVQAMIEMEIEGNNPDAPFVLIATSNALGAAGGAYAQVSPLDGAESVTIAVYSIGKTSQSSPVFTLYITEQDGAYTTDQKWAPFWEAVQIGKVRALVSTTIQDGSMNMITRELTVWAVFGQFVMLHSPRILVFGDELKLYLGNDGNGGIEITTTVD